VLLKNFNQILFWAYIYVLGLCRGADKSLARPSSRCILFDSENISFVLVLLYR